MNDFFLPGQENVVKTGCSTESFAASLPEDCEALQ
jgi:hypothetical protein